jgi:hypothetical protein
VNVFDSNQFALLETSQPLEYHGTEGSARDGGHFLTVYRWDILDVPTIGLYLTVIRERSHHIHDRAYVHSSGDRAISLDHSIPEKGH